MSDHRLTIADIDHDGAFGDAADGLFGPTRAQLLQGALLGGAAFLVAGAQPVKAAGRSRDVDIINYALALEYIQDAFYSEVERLGSLRGGLAEQARTVGAHERAHVRALRDALGSRAIKRPRFDFRGATESPSRFRQTAVAFEDLAVAAYKGQAGLVDKRGYLVALLGIHSVEARHAAWIRRLAGIQPAARPFDEPRSKASTLRIVERANFTVTMTARKRPRYTG